MDSFPDVDERASRRRSECLNRCVSRWLQRDPRMGSPLGQRSERYWENVFLSSLRFFPRVQSVSVRLDQVGWVSTSGAIRLLRGEMGGLAPMLWYLKTMTC